MTETTGESPHCLNCGAPITGQYCGQCGQRANTRLISLWELIRDAFGDLFELDSRLWRTLIPLLFRPGQLTRDYLRGRRARFMPPFRMYLVLSLIFFVVAFFDPRQQFAIFFEPDEPSSDTELESRNDDAREVLEELVREGVLDESVLEPGGPLAPPIPDGATPELPDAAADETEGALTLDFDQGSANCNFDGDVDFGVESLNRRFSKERLSAICNRIVADGGAGVIAALLDNVSVALIILLPLMAVVLKALYPLSRRFYVEHLLFFVHFHSFGFLLLTLQILWARFVDVTGMHGAVSVLPIVATSFYVPVYLYKAMRRVYGQGRAMTALKFVALTITYAVGFVLMLFSALLFAVFSV
ncbi:MAG: DUF3667 domain-containing protein [Woeseiaceae bacterium]|nr:DUF3667 domain-containing protein [Woeseiaceae bacterium]